MNKTNLTETLYRKLESQGLKVKMTSIRHLNDLKKEIEGKHQAGIFNEVFFRKWLAQFKFSIPETLNTAKSIIVTATPQPQVRVTFTWKGKLYPIIIPPTYFYHTDQQVQNSLEEVLGPEGYKLEKVVLPIKFLAVSSGLAQYGRNNITYIEGLGSFYRLKGYFTDLPIEEDLWFEPRVMDACAHCKACEKGCPTGAIGGDRFMIRAEKCLTYWNEGEEAFPDWVDPSCHNSLVGCMKCQLACPQNKKFKDWIEDQSRFDELETELLLKGVSKNTLPAETVEKLEKTGLIDYLEMLPRNLGVLLSK
jgi:epoxyqueuosine reductase